MSSEEKLRFGSYEVLQREDGSNIVLGKGGFGRIYKARHAILGRITALKVIKEESLQAGGANDKEKISEFKAEARAVAMLNHPGIAHIHDCASEDGVFYQATEYCEGGTLQEYCDKFGPITWETARLMVIRILRGLEYAHANGIVHRDIKPANVMLAKSGSLDEPKIIDFGLAKSLAGDVADPSATLRGGADVGGHTPATASPEQLRGSPDEPPDGRTDLFSLGVLIWWILIGRNPFGDMKTGPLYADRLSPASYDSRLPEDLHHEAREILVMLLEKDRNKRVSSATRLIEILEAKAAPQTQAEEERLPPAPVTEPMPAPPDFDDGWSLGSLIRSVPHGKMYEVRRLSDSCPGIALNVSPGMDVRLLAGLRLAASRNLDLGVLRFLDWRLNGSDDAFILTPPSGCNLLSVLRKVGSSRFRDALPFLVQLAKGFDTSCGWLGCGIQIDPSDIHVRHVSGVSDPDTFSSWDDIDMSSVACLPLLEDGGEGGASTEATISTSTQGFPPLARFAALVYRVVSGSAVSHAAFYTDSGYVMASGFSEDGNALIADTLCNPEPDTRLGHFLQMLSALESQPVGEIIPLLAPPSAAEIASASLPLAIPARVQAPSVKAASPGTSSVDDEIAELQRQIERKKSEAAARKAAEEAAAKKAEEDRLRKLEEERLAEEARAAAEEARIAEENERLRREQERREAEAAKAKMEFEEKLKREAREAAERAEKERQRELQAELEAKQALAAEQRAAEAARLAAEKKRRDELAAAEKERERHALIEEKRQLEKRREEEAAREKEEKRKPEEKRKEEKRLKEEEDRRKEADRKAAALAAKAKPPEPAGKFSVAVPREAGSRKKIYAIAAIVAFVAVASAVAIISIPGDKPSSGGGKPQVAQKDKDAGKVTEVKSPVEVDPVIETPQPPPPAPTFTVNFTKPPKAGEGYPYSAFSLVEIGEGKKRLDSTDGNLTVERAKPGTGYLLTLHGDVAGKKGIPLAQTTLKLPEATDSDKSLAVTLPASLPALEIRNPSECSDYSEITVSPPPANHETDDIVKVHMGAPTMLSRTDFFPSPELSGLPPQPVPAKDKPIRYPVTVSGKWSLRYSGSQLEDRTESVATDNSVEITLRNVPKPLGGRYRVLLPMLRFPDGKENSGLKPVKDAPRKNETGEWEVDYFNRMTYPDYSESFKALKSKNILGERELPHYLAISFDLRFTKNTAGESIIKLIRNSPLPDLIYSKSDGVDLDFEDTGGEALLMLDVMSGQGFYRSQERSLPTWVKKYEDRVSLMQGEIKQNAIHGFFQDSCLTALDALCRSGQVAPRFVELKKALEVESWPSMSFPGNYEIVLKREDDGFSVRKVSEIVTYESLYHKDEKYRAPDGSGVIRSVLFDVQRGSTPVLLEKED